VVQGGLVRAIALDVGSKTIGVAVSDLDGTIARAHTVLPRAGQQADAARVCELIREHEAATVVIGLPLELDGSEGHRARLVQRFVTALEQLLGERGLTIELARWDERFSTAAAERTLLEADVSRAKRRKTVDAVAAAFILQGWLDARAHAREHPARR
jgi:putative Holliday junction resolvase